MTPEQFCYWLQGFVELTQAPPTADQWKAISDCLAGVTVFEKVKRGATPGVLPAHWHTSLNQYQGMNLGGFQGGREGNRQGADG